jgi:hypothetical protein
MTLADIKNDLFTWFGSHDAFSLDENFDELYVLIPNEEKAFVKAAIEKALQEYEEQKVVVKVEHSKKKTWVLDKPLERYSQTIELTYPTLVALTKFVNEYCDSIKNKEAKVNPLNVTERDVASVLVIASQSLMGAPNV